jgi:hypothetical protein
MPLKLGLMSLNRPKTLIRILVVWVVIGVILFTRFFPNYYAVIKTPPGYIYSGQTSLYDPDDINVYVSAVKYGQTGNILLKNLYTTTDDSAALIYPLYTVSGFLFPRTDPYIIFDVLKIITGILLCLVVFILSRILLGSFRYSVLSLFLVIRGGGFGWFMAEKLQAADLVYSGITFNTSLQRAHEGLGMILFITAMTCHFLLLQKARTGLFVVSALAALFLTLLYPYYLLTYALVIGILTAAQYFRTRAVRLLSFYLVEFLVIGVLAGTYYLSLAGSGFASATREQIPIVSPFSLIMGYGVFVVLFASLRFINKTSVPKDLIFFLNLWVIVSVILSYLPFGFSRLFLRGLFFPLVLLSLIYIRHIFDVKLKKVVIFLFCLFLPLTSYYVFASRIRAVNVRDNLIYISEDTNAMFNFLTTKTQDGILSFYRLGNFIPAKTGKSVYFGHWTQTPDAAAKADEIYKFYAGLMTDTYAEYFLAQNHISYIIYGREEISLGGHLYPFLKLVYVNQSVRVYTL